MISAQEWDRIKEELGNVYGVVMLECDGYTVMYRPLISDRTLKICVCGVNGVLRGSWMVKGGEEATRFFRKEEKFVSSKKNRDELKRIYGGAKCPKSRLAEINQKMSFWVPTWLSPKNLINHLKRNNVEMRVLAIGLCAYSIKYGAIGARNLDIDLDIETSELAEVTE